MNVISGRKQEHGFVDVCSDGTATCVLDPTTWVPGQTQTLNLGLERKSEAPFFPESFGQRYMKERDEVWLGVTWEF